MRMVRAAIRIGVWAAAPLTISKITARVARRTSSSRTTLRSQFTNSLDVNQIELDVCQGALLAALALLIIALIAIRAAMLMV